MEILDLLAAEHRDVQLLFSEYAGLAVKALHSRQTVAARIFAAIDAHARLEEEVFYPELETSTVTADAIRAARTEHAEIRMLIRALRESRHADALFETRMTALAESFAQHIYEEEEEIFPAAADVLGSKRLADLATRAQALRAELEEPPDVEAPPIPPVPRL